MKMVLLQELQLREVRNPIPWRSDDCRREFLEEEKSYLKKKKIIGTKKLKAFLYFFYYFDLLL